MSGPYYTLAQARETLVEFWKTQFADVQGWTTSQYCFDNKPFDPPAATTPPTAPTVWARFVVRELARRQQSMGQSGSRRWESRCLAVTQLFIQGGVGVDVIDGLATTVRSLFEGADIGPGIVCFQTQVNEIGFDLKRSWYQYNVNATARYYELH